MGGSIFPYLLSTLPHSSRCCQAAFLPEHTDGSCSSGCQDPQRLLDRAVPRPNSPQIISSQGVFYPGVGLDISCSKLFCWPIFPSCLGLSELQPCPLALNFCLVPQGKRTLTQTPLINKHLGPLKTEAFESFSS